LEDRSLLSVEVLSSFMGLGPGAGDAAPPNPQVAAGPDHVVEVVNSQVAVFDKGVVRRVVWAEPLSVFFGPLEQGGGILPQGEPVVAYDESAGHFVVAVADRSALEFAVSATSDPSDPEGSFRAMHRIVFPLPASPGPGVGSDGGNLRLGWTAGAYVFTLDDTYHTGVHEDDGSDDPRPGFRVVAVDKTAALDPNLSDVPYFDLSYYNHYRSVGVAAMHGSAAGDPLWLVLQSYDDPASRELARLTGLLSGQPDLTEYPFTYDAAPPDRLGLAAPELLHLSWRGGRLAVSYTVGAGDLARAVWYDIDTTGDVPFVTWAGEIDPGLGVDTFLPSVEIAANGDLGMSFLQSSPRQPLSMYVTGLKRTDPVVEMQAPVLVQPGAAGYIGPVGRYSGIAVDPLTGTSFWAANAYATDAAANNWGTWVAEFSVGGDSPAVALAAGRDGAPDGTTLAGPDRTGSEVGAVPVGSSPLGHVESTPLRTGGPSARTTALAPSRAVGFTPRVVRVGRGPAGARGTLAREVFGVWSEWPPLAGDDPWRGVIST
jgi:hypothetical protein